MTIIKCLICNLEFTPKNSNQKYCSTKCGYTAGNRQKKEKGYKPPPKKQKQIDKVCKKCGKQFASKYSKTKYCSRDCVNNAARENKKTFQHTEETKQIIREARIEYLFRTGKHRWSDSCGHKESLPEKNFRLCLIDLQISCFQYYRPSNSERFFEMDFAIPEKQIAFEINGQQHYQSNGLLAPYYQARHDYLENLGWVLHEIHYSECFYPDKIKKLIIQCIGLDTSYQSSTEIINHRLKRKQDKQDEEEQKHIAKELKKQNIKLQTHKCAILRPTKEELHKLVWSKPTTHIAKQFDVSDKAIGKWCKAYGIDKPPRGYWTKKAYNS